MDKNTCGCMNAMANTCACGESNDLLMKLRQVDFAIIEATLYLDVYPDCCEAKEYLTAMREKRAKIAAEYESKHGMLTMYGVCGETSGAQCAWPWEYAAN